MSVLRRVLRFGFLALLLGIAGCAARKNEPAEGLSEKLRTLADTYRLTIVVERPGFPVTASYGTVDGQPASKDQVDRYTPLLLSEWELYPPELVKNTGLRRIVLCKGLSFAGQVRNAVPEFESDTLYLEVVRGRENETYMRKVIHHEFYHIIDYKDDGQLYRDERWAQLNPRTFRYGTGGRNAQDDPGVSLLAEDVPGFLNKYSRTGVEEDKAEVFAHMIVEPKMLEKRAAKDAVLRAKVERMKELVEKFSPRTDKTFWDKIRRTRAE